jgi:PEP-CTERM motif
VFPISAADLTVLSGSVNDLLSGVTQLRIINSPFASEAVPGAGVLGVDNINAAGALAVPEPTSLALLSTGILLLGLTRRRRIL